MSTEIVHEEIKGSQKKWKVVATFILYAPITILFAMIVGGLAFMVMRNLQTISQIIAYVGQVIIPFSLSTRPRELHPWKRRF